MSDAFFALEFFQHASMTALALFGPEIRFSATKTSHDELAEMLSELRKITDIVT